MTREEEIRRAAEAYDTNNERYQYIFTEGAEWADSHRWHKVTEELPEEKHYKENTLQGIREWTESDIVLVIDNHYLKTVDSLKNGEWMKLRTHPKDCDGFPIEYLYWMEIPEIKED